MLKKENAIPFILLGVGAAFIVVSMLVFLSKGNPKLVRYKLKLGAIIIGLTATVVSCKPTVSCYEPALPPDMFTFDVDSNSYHDTIKLKLPNDSLLTGRISQISKTQYSFMIQDLSMNEKYRDNILPEDGVFNSSEERFIINIPNSLDTGTYYLKAFASEKTQINPDLHKASRKIRITK